MNKEQKAAVVDEVATQIKEADAVFAVDYRGLSVTQAVELRARLDDVQAGFRVVKNRLTSRAADKAGAETLKQLLEGPTAFAFVRGDAALAAKAIATFRRERGLLEFKGGTLGGDPLTIDQLESIARLPGRDQLRGQFVGVLASPLTGLVRGLGSMIQGLAIQLEQIREQGLVGEGGRGEADESTAEGEASTAEGEASTAEGEGTAAGDDRPDVGDGSTAEGAGSAAEGGQPDPASAEDASRAAAAEEDAPQSEGEEETSGEAGEEQSADASDEKPDASEEAEAKED